MPFDHEQPSIAELPIAAIRVEGRFRRELGDIASLAARITEVGLLNPIVVTPDHRLIAGQRRLEAMRKLGRTHVRCGSCPSMTSFAASSTRTPSAPTSCRASMSP